MFQTHIFLHLVSLGLFFFHFEQSGQTAHFASRFHF